MKLFNCFKAFKFLFLIYPDIKYFNLIKNTFQIVSKLMFELKEKQKKHHVLSKKKTN